MAVSTSSGHKEDLIAVSLFPGSRLAFLVTYCTKEMATLHFAAPHVAHDEEVGAMGSLVTVHYQPSSTVIPAGDIV